ncbi:unnamed protein product [Parajaminaea phylloscopi]
MAFRTYLDSTLHIISRNTVRDDHRSLAVLISGAAAQTWRAATRSRLLSAHTSIPDVDTMSSRDLVMVLESFVARLQRFVMAAVDPMLYQRCLPTSYKAATPDRRSGAPDARDVSLLVEVFRQLCNPEYSTSSSDAAVTDLAREAEEGASTETSGISPPPLLTIADVLAHTCAEILKEIFASPVATRPSSLTATADEASSAGKQHKSEAPTIARGYFGPDEMLDAAQLLCPLIDECVPHLSAAQTRAADDADDERPSTGNDGSGTTARDQLHHQLLCSDSSVVDLLKSCLPTMSHNRRQQGQRHVARLSICKGPQLARARARILETVHWIAQQGGTEDEYDH